MMIITNGKKKNWRRLKLSIWSIKWWKCFPEFSIQSWRMLSGKVLATRQYYAFENLQILMKYGAHEYTLLWSECALSLFNIRTRFSWLLFLMHLDNTKFPSPPKLILLARRHAGMQACRFHIDSHPFLALLTSSITFFSFCYLWVHVVMCIVIFLYIRGRLVYFSALKFLSVWCWA